MRVKGFAAVGAIFFAAAMFFTVPTAATAAAEQQTTVSSRTAAFEACSENTEASSGRHTAGECPIIGGIDEWNAKEVGDDVYLLESIGSVFCLTTDGQEIFLVRCDPDDDSQRWQNVTPEGVIGAAWYENVAYPDICVIITMSIDSQE
jgi:hypothetical protein